MINNFSKNYIALRLGCEYRNKNKKFWSCQIHENEPLKFYCEKCDIVFCPLCIVDHTGHKFIE